MMIVLITFRFVLAQAMMIAAEELRLMDAKEASTSYSKPEIEEIQERSSADLG